MESKKLFLRKIERKNNKNVYVLKDSENKYYFMNNNLNKCIKFVQKNLKISLSENFLLSEIFLKDIFNKKGFIYL